MNISSSFSVKEDHKFSSPRGSFLSWGKNCIPRLSSLLSQTFHCMQGKFSVAPKNVKHPCQEQFKGAADKTSSSLVLGGAFGSTTPPRPTAPGEFLSVRTRLKVLLCPWAWTRCPTTQPWCISWRSIALIEIKVVTLFSPWVSLRPPSTTGTRTTSGASWLFVCVTSTSARSSGCSWKVSVHTYRHDVIVQSCGGHTSPRPPWDVWLHTRPSKWKKLRLLFLVIYQCYFNLSLPATRSPSNSFLFLVP